ncbi:DUF3034 family protein [Edaphobacter aggregans]|uniref:DUF3034 family protein n=1 Tax=Edaphobacter aggregans TaxID=570835 RepID=UPI00054FBC21|nr:DUF3034 family protein [Edaphobacter aggregans]
MKYAYASIRKLMERSSAPVRHLWAPALLVALFLVAHPASLFAQALGWEGETGVFVTPTAYTIPTPERRFAIPVASYHYLNGGSVLGTFNQMSITSGYANRIEFGYTRDFHATGSDPALSPLWTDGFNTFHGKGVLIKENSWKKPWMPEISTGFMVRTQVHNVGGAITHKDTHNEDVYLIGSKMITQLKPMPVLISAGVRGTNAELWGLGGNTPDFTARAFGNVAFVFQGPAKSTVILGMEVAQQPRHPSELPNATIRTTMVYAARVLPSPKLKLNLDVGVLEGPGVIAPGVDLKAKSRPAFALSYAF